MLKIGTLLALSLACNTSTNHPATQQATDNMKPPLSEPMGIPVNTIFFLAEVAPTAHDSEGNARWAVTADRKFWYSRNNAPITNEAYSAPVPTYFVSPLQEIPLTTFPEEAFMAFVNSIKSRPLCKGVASDDGSRYYLFYKSPDRPDQTMSCFSEPGDPDMRTLQTDFFKIFEQLIQN